MIHSLSKPNKLINHAVHISLNNRICKDLLSICVQVALITLALIENTLTFLVFIFLVIYNLYFNYWHITQLMFV